MLIVIAAVGCGGGAPPEKSLAEQLNDARQLPSAEARAAALIRIADLQRAGGDTMDAKSTLATASSSAEQIEHAYTKATTLAQIAAAQAVISTKQIARGTLRKAAKAVKEIEDPHMRMLASLEQAEAALKLEDQGQALSLLKSAEQLAGDVELPDASCDCLLNVASGYHAADQQDEAKRVINATLVKIRELENARRKSDLLGDAALALRRSNEADVATWQGVLTESQQMAEGITDPLARSYALVHLAECLNTVGKQGDAETILVKAEADADKVTDNAMRGPLIEAIRKQQASASSG
jgi:hypothetical protein